MNHYQICPTENAKDIPQTEEKALMSKKKRYEGKNRLSKIQNALLVENWCLSPLTSE